LVQENEFRGFVRRGDEEYKSRNKYQWTRKIHSSTNDLLLVQAIAIFLCVDSTLDFTFGKITVKIPLSMDALTSVS
jgi:hypothetical protein